MNMMVEQAAKRQKLVLESSIHVEIKDLPDDLVIEILCRLPHHKYAFQCKCISKRWLSLISNPYFVRRFVTHISSKNQPEEQPWAFMYFKFLDRSYRYFKKDEEEYDAPTPKLISQYSEFKSPGFSLKFLPCYQHQREDDQEPITIVKTVNDLILCCGDKFDKSECVYYICNPQTMQWVALPPTPPLLPELRCLEVEFICEPYYYKKIDEHHQGNVILDTQFKFKVLRFLNYISSSNYNLQIFSSETGQWNLNKVLLPPKTLRPAFGIMRSLFCKGKLTLIAVGKSPDFGLSAITVDDHFDKCLERVKFPGDMFCRRPFRSIMHLSSWQESLLIAQISINYVAHQPNYGVPVLRIWKLDDSNNHVVQWKLRHSISFRNIASGNQWISDYYLKERTFIIRENGQVQYLMPIILGFHPGNADLLYLNLNCDGRMGLYDMTNRTLNFVSKTWWQNSSFPLYSVPKRFRWSAAFELVLPLWPTPVPQISQAAAPPYKD